MIFRLERVQTIAEAIHSVVMVCVKTDKTSLNSSKEKCIKLKLLWIFITFSYLFHYLFLTVAGQQNNMTHSAEYRLSLWPFEDRSANEMQAFP